MASAVMHGGAWPDVRAHVVFFPGIHLAARFFRHSDKVYL
jgi:hypothetical protein